MLDRVQVLLHVHAAVAKGFLGLAGGRLKGALHVLFPLNQADALAAAAGAGLNQHGIADVGSGLLGLLGVPQDVGARGGGDVVLLHQAAGGVLVAHVGDDLRRRADEHHAVLLAQGGEPGVFREEAIARVDGLGVGGQSRADNALSV